MGIHLEKQGFYEFIVNSNISHHLKTRYGNLINFIIYGVMEDGYGYLMPTYNNFTHETLVLHVFELKQRISIATNTPNALVNFIEEIKAEMNENLHWEEYYVYFIKELENKWAIALFKYLASLYGHDADKLIVETEENEGCDEDDENLYFKILSSNTFWIKIKGVENPAKRYRTENDSAIVAAVGDANTSAHFFTGSGLSTGKPIKTRKLFLFQEKIATSRLGVEKAILKIKEFNRSSDEQLNLKDMIEVALKGVRNRVLEKTKVHLNILPGIYVDENY
uniref:Uncharacterized protein n=1 Tax=Meloidogyne javanica TaxID=6303 RepID=A0A915LI27_MELJA